MKIKTASDLFKIDEKVIRRSIEDGLIKKYKNGRYIEIPDDIKFIPIKKDVKYFLYQILQFKNNPHYPVSREMCQNEEQMAVFFEFLYKEGFITNYAWCSDINKLLSNVTLTEKSFGFIFGSNVVQKIINVNILPINFNATLNAMAMVR